jgi:hypothetical protein
MDYANGGSGTYWGAKEDRPVNDSRVPPDEGPEQGPTEPQKPEIKQPTIYYDNYGNPTNDPHDFTGKQQGDSPLSAKQIFDYIVSIITNAGLMGKEYVDSGSPTYVCSDFLRDTVNLLKLSIEKYLPGGQLVSNSIKLFDKKDYILPSAGSNPASGVYVFYKLYKNDYNGHVGIVYFDGNNKAHVLHNGAVKNSSEMKVNIYDSDSTNFNEFFRFDQKNPIIYKQITMKDLFPLW